MLNIAVVGLGKWGLRHAQSAAASGRFKVVKGVDMAKVDVGFPVTESLEEVLDDKAIDAVSIATPHTLHADQIRMAANAGKHILAEKPFALSYQDGLSNVKVTRENKVVLALGHDQRFYPAVTALKDMITQSVLGNLATVQSVLSHDFTKKALEKMNALAAANKESKGTVDWWRVNLEEAPVGPMVHLGIHHLDLFIYLFGSIDWVLARSPGKTLDTPFPDSMLVTVGFNSGLIGTINSSLASPLNSRFLMSGSEGWAEGIGPDDVESYTQSSMNTIRRRISDEPPEKLDFPLIDSVAENFAAFC